MTDTTGTPPAPAAPPPAEPQGDNGAGKTYTQAEVDQMLRGSGSALKKAQEQAAALTAAEAERTAASEAAERERLAKQGEFKTLATQAEARAVEAEQKLAAANLRETERLEAVAKTNKADIAELPEEYRGLADGLTGDALTAQVAKLKKLAGVQSAVPVHGGAPRGGGAPVSAEEQKRIDDAAIRKTVFGDKKVISYRNVPGGDND